MRIITDAISAVAAIAAMAKSAYEPGPPCPPWCDSESKMLMQSKPGLGQGRDKSWTMPQREKPGLGQGLGQGEISWLGIVWFAIKMFHPALGGVRNDNGAELLPQKKRLVENAKIC